MAEKMAVARMAKGLTAIVVSSVVVPAAAAAVAPAHARVRMKVAKVRVAKMVVTVVEIHASDAIVHVKLARYNDND